MRYLTLEMYNNDVDVIEIYKRYLRTGHITMMRNVIDERDMEISQHLCKCMINMTICM